MAETQHFGPLAAAAGALVAVALLMLVLVVEARPAGATFPGKNGNIAFSSNRTTTNNPTDDQGKEEKGHVSWANWRFLRIASEPDRVVSLLACNKLKSEAELKEGEIHGCEKPTMSR